MSRTPANVGLTFILFSGEASIGSGVISSAYRVYVNVHDFGSNRYAPLSSRDGTDTTPPGMFQIVGILGDNEVTFRNISTTVRARYTIKTVPIIIHDAAHAGL